MKQIPLLQGKALLVEMPEGATNPEIHNRSLTFDTPLEVDEWGYDYQAVKLPEGNWRIVSTLADLTEEQADGLVEWHEVLQYYPDYSMYGLWNGDITALESFHSAIRASGWYLENPHGEEPKPDNTPNYAYSVDVRIWESAQSRTLNPELTLILERK